MRRKCYKKHYFYPGALFQCTSLVFQCTSLVFQCSSLRKSFIEIDGNLYTFSIGENCVLQTVNLFREAEIYNVFERLVYEKKLL